jgi:hypothetical protein
MTVCVRVCERRRERERERQRESFPILLKTYYVNNQASLQGNSLIFYFGLKDL